MAAAEGDDNFVATRAVFDPVAASTKAPRDLPPASPANGESRRVASDETLCSVVPAPDMPISSQHQHPHDWRTGGDDTGHCSPRPTAAIEMSTRTTENAPEPRPAPMAPSPLPSRPAAAEAAAAATSPSFCRQRSPVPRPPHQNPNAMLITQVAGGDGGGARGGYKCSGSSNMEGSCQQRARGEAFTRDDSVRVGVEYDERIRLAERRAGAAEAAERVASAAAVAAANEAKVATDAMERLRMEGLNLSKWRDAVLELRDVLKLAEGHRRRDGNGRDLCDGEYMRWGRQEFGVMR